MGTETIIALILGLVDRVAAYGQVLAKAKAEGRDVTDAEIGAAVAADNEAQKTERAAITVARIREALKAKV